MSNRISLNSALVGAIVRGRLVFKEIWYIMHVLKMSIRMRNISFLYEVYIEVCLRVV